MECDHHGDDTGDKLDGEGIMRVNVIVMEMMMLIKLIEGDDCKQCFHDVDEYC